MDRLPLELHEQIFSHLLSHEPREQLVALPASTDSERSDIYNLRLTSRHICLGASRSFVNIVQDVPTQCRKESLNYLAALVEIPSISSQLTCLALSTDKLSRLYDADCLTEDHADMDVLLAWLQDELHASLVSIMQKASRVRHLVYLFRDDAWRKSFINRMRSQPQKSQAATPTPIPFHILQSALAITRLTETLESFVILQKGLFDFAHSSDDPIFFTSSDYLSLRHLTFQLPSTLTPDDRLNAPCLTSIHVVMNRGSWLEHKWKVALRNLFPKLPPTLKSYIISGSNEEFDTEEFFWFITPTFERVIAVPLLRIRDLRLLVDISDEVPEVKETLRIDLLVFENVTYCLQDQITLSGPTDPRNPDQRCKPFAALFQHAKEIRIIPSTIKAAVPR